MKRDFNSNLWSSLNFFSYGYEKIKKNNLSIVKHFCFWFAVSLYIWIIYIPTVSVMMDSLLSKSLTYEKLYSV